VKVTKTYFMLYATNVPRAVAFYRDAFHLDVQVESPYWSELAWQGATIALHGRENGPDATTETGLGFEVDDLDAACQAVVNSRREDRYAARRPPRGGHQAGNGRRPGTERLYASRDRPARADRTRLALLTATFVSD
jgi:hypothetical protein